MIQCVVCEDWLHGRVRCLLLNLNVVKVIWGSKLVLKEKYFLSPQHLGCGVPESVELQEMVCESCMNKAPFLWTYAAHIASMSAPVLQQWQLPLLLLLLFFCYYDHTLQMRGVRDVCCCHEVFVTFAVVIRCYNILKFNYLWEMLHNLKWVNSLLHNNK